MDPLALRLELLVLKDGELPTDKASALSAWHRAREVMSNLQQQDPWRAGQAELLARRHYDNAHRLVRQEMQPELDKLAPHLDKLADEYHAHFSAKGLAHPAELSHPGHPKQALVPENNSWKTQKLGALGKQIGAYPVPPHVDPETHMKWRTLLGEFNRKAEARFG